MTRVAELKQHGAEFQVEKVELGDVEGAVKLAEYFKNHIRRTFTGLYGENRLDRLAADLKAFLLERDGTYEGTFGELHGQLDSEHKPEYPKELGKYVRAICKRTPSLTLEEGQRTADKRPIRITLESLSSLSSLSSDEAAPEEDEWEEF